MTKRPKPIVLTVLDGWGHRAETTGNAIALARKPNYDRLVKDFANTLIQTSGPAVGLPDGQIGNIATVVGRYYAMDRDNRWERIELAYRAMVHGESEIRSNDPVAALNSSYEAGVTDEFVKPIVITNDEAAGGTPAGLIRDDDAVIFFNFRADRARQMTYALAAPDFDKFTDPKRPKNLFYVAMTQYDKNWPWLQSVIKPDKLEQILAQVFADLNYKNLRT